MEYETREGLTWIEAANLVSDGWEMQGPGKEYWNVLKGNRIIARKGNSESIGGEYDIFILPILGKYKARRPVSYPITPEAK